jgi:hypothetical protein
MKDETGRTCRTSERDEKHGGKISFGRFSWCWKDNIKIGIRKIGRERVNWIKIAQGRF